MSEPLSNESPPGAPADAPRKLHAHRILLLFLGAVLLIWLFSGFYQVSPNQVAIVERLGEYLSNIDGKIDEIKPGLHYHLPWPIDNVHLVSTTETLTLNVSNFNESPAAYADMKYDLRKQNWDDAYINALFDPYLITADKSIVNMQVKATYVIGDASLWLKTVSHESDVAGEPNDMRAQLFQHLAQRAMIHQTSRMSLQDILFDQRGQLPQDLLATMRNDFIISERSVTAAGETALNTIDLGINIQKVDVVELHPPTAVAPAYDQVSNARQMRVTRSEAAAGFATQQTTRAGAEAATMLLEAKSYANGRTEEARGEADRFALVLDQYHADPSNTRARLLADAVSLISGDAKQIFIAQPGQRTILTIPPPKFDAGQTTTSP